MARNLRVGMTLTFLAAGAAAIASLTACPIATAGIYESYMSIDGERRRNEFFSDTTNIVCSVEVRGARTNVTTELLIRQTQVLTLEPPLRATDTNVILAYADFQGAGKQILELKPAENKDAGEQPQVKPFPVGRFQCEVYLDGKLEDTLPFNVNYAPCPPQRIEPGARCGGFYEKNRSCPAGGAGIPEAGPPQVTAGTCTCDGSATAVWVCK